MLGKKAWKQARSLVEGKGAIAVFGLRSYNPDYFCLWHFSDMPPAPTNVRYRR